MAYVRTHNSEAGFCKDPECGLHIIPYKGDKPICEVVLSADDTLGLIEFCRKRLQQSNADRTMSNIPDNRRHESATGICPLEPEVPRAARQVSTFCNDPKCGLHIVPYDSDDKPICEIVTSLNQTWMIIGRSKAYIYTATRITETMPDTNDKVLKVLRLNALKIMAWTEALGQIADRNSLPAEAIADYLEALLDFHSCVLAEPAEHSTTPPAEAKTAARSGNGCSLTWPIIEVTLPPETIAAVNRRVRDLEERLCSGDPTAKREG